MEKFTFPSKNWNKVNKSVKCLTSCLFFVFVSLLKALGCRFGWVSPQQSNSSNLDVYGLFILYSCIPQIGSRLLKLHSFAWSCILYPKTAGGFLTYCSGPRFLSLSNCLWLQTQRFRNYCFGRKRLDYYGDENNVLWRTIKDAIGRKHLIYNSIWRIV